MPRIVRRKFATAGEISPGCAMMVGMFHVFIEGAKDSSPGGVQRLAEAIAKHYGLAAADLKPRIASGKFRVKGNVDRATADKYVRDLDILGARCVIEEANAGNSRPTPLPFPAVRPATPLPIAEAPARPSAPKYSSGLSAAFSGDMPAASLGALEQGSALSLASVDGSDAQKREPPAASFAPPDSMQSASIGPPPEPPKAGVKFADKKPAAPDKKPARPKDEPLDLFVPPEVAEGGFSVELAVDEPNPRRRASTPPAGEPAVMPSEEELKADVKISTPRKSQPVIAAQPAKRGNPLADTRVRFAAGVVLAILLGFVPAHFVAAMREKSAFDEVDRKVIAAQEDPSTPYDSLDQLRADQMSRKQSDRRSVAIIAFLIWGAVGGGVAYGWFKRIPWERLES
jgi:hypothetical protein